MPGGAAELERGRSAVARREWATAYEALRGADAEEALAAEDLELIATCAYMLGLDEEYRGALERACRTYADGGASTRAARCTWWIGHNLLFHGQSAPAEGWFARGRRLLERAKLDCVEHGYLMIPALLDRVFANDFEAARAKAAEIAEIADGFGDRDLFAIALMEQGHALVRQGKTDEGLRLVDESMVAVTTGELSPIVAGILYCNTIAFCRDVFELRRAREWTGALTRWCEQQPGMVTHQGLCLVHRAELMTFGGEWQDALEEARLVRRRFALGALNERALGHAAYRRGEVHRLRGEHVAAETAYREASRLGREPEPGISLLRLAAGKPEAAAAAIRRALGETTRPFARVAILPAAVEIMLAVGSLDESRAAADQLDEIAERQASEVLRAMSAYARGSVALAEGDADVALQGSRRAWRAWRDLEAPYEAARARVLAGLACRALGDEDSATLELEGAAASFAELGARPDLAHVEALLGRTDPGRAHGLTKRELEVLRLVAAGRSNRAIAAELYLSDHTVRRHLQNIFRKLDVSSRAAATAFAFEHDLI